MEKNINPSHFEEFDQTYEEALLKKEQFGAVKEAIVLSHIARYCEQPLTKIPIIDMLKDMGPCPCIKCFRDEFI